MITLQERERIKQVAKKASQAVGKGATTLIESFATGFGAGVAKTASGAS